MRRSAVLLLAGALLVPVLTRAQQRGVSATVHNLSVSGPGSVRALEETEVCKFCHIPHNAVVPAPLWGHALSRVDRYEVPTLRRGKEASEPAPQPDGSSRLCLSCHDGTVALGDVGGSGPIASRYSTDAATAKIGYRITVRMLPMAALTRDPKTSKNSIFPARCIGPPCKNAQVSS